MWLFGKDKENNERKLVKLEFLSNVTEWMKRKSCTGKSLNSIQDVKRLDHTQDQVSVRLRSQNSHTFTTDM